MKKFYFLIILALLPFVANAAVEIDGMYYNLTSGETNTAEVISGSNKYSGDVVIPASVIYNDVTYSVTSIGDYAFQGCSDLTSVTIPNSITSIGYYSFSWCSGLTSLNIPNSVTSIREAAFSWCSGLTSVTIPNNVTSIGDYAFYQCSGLTSVTIPNSVTSIGNYAFSGCSGLTSMTIPNSVTSIGEWAFYNCSGLTSVVIGSGVTSIGSYAFRYTNLKKTIWLTNTPPSGASYASGAVNYVANDQYNISNKIVYPFLSSYFDVDGIRYVPVSLSDRTCDAIDCVYNESAKDTKIAATVTNKGVTLNVKNVMPYVGYANTYIENLTIDNDGELGNYSFSDCSNMKTVELGNNLSAIGSYAFSGCSSLKAIDIPEIVTVLNESTFSGCTSLESIKIKPLMTDIKNNVFYNCTSLKEVIIADSETELKLGSNGSSPIFSSCPLDTVYIGRNVSYSTSKNYGYSPFYRNTSLRAVKITDKEDDISENEFYGCTNLQRVIIGDGVKSIGDWAFSGCQSLKFFAFGTKVEAIGQEAFSDCTAVTEISSKAGTPPTCGSQALDDINKWECKLIVPKGCLTAYQEAEQWKEFLFVEESEFAVETYYTLTYLVDGEVYKTYQLKAGDPINPEPAPKKEGYEFSGWSPIPATMPAENLTITGTFTKILPYDEIKITSAGQTTWCSKYDLDFTEEDGLKVYTATGYNTITGTIWLSRVKEVPAREGILIMGDEGVYKIPHKATGNYYANLMVGTLEAMTLYETDGEYTNYYLSKGTEGVGFYKVNGSVKLGAHRAYLPLKKGTTGNANTRYIGFTFDDGATNIDPLSASDADESNAAYYNLQGQRVDNPTKGLYIKNGHKVVIK